MTEGSGGAIWFGVSNGVLQYDGLIWKHYTAENGFTDATVNMITATPSGHICVATDSNVYLYKNEKWSKQLVTPDYFRFQSQLYRMMTASDGSIWIPSRFGAVRFQDDIFLLYREDGIYHLSDELKRSFIEYPVTSIIESNSGKIWFCRPDGFLLNTGNHLNRPSRWQLLHPEQTDLGPETQALYDEKDRIWMISGSHNHGVYIFDVDKKQWSSFCLSEFGGLDYYTCIFQTRDRAMWIGGIGLLYGYRQGHWRLYRNPEVSIPLSRIIGFEASEGSIWIGGLHNDVIRCDYSNARWTSYQGLHYQCDTPDGQQWFVSVDKRVVGNQQDTWLSYGPEDGLIDHPFTLICTRDNVIWAAGSHGQYAATACFKDGKWVRHIHANVSWCIDYRAVYESADGCLWFCPSANTFSGGILQYIPSTDTWIHHRNNGAPSDSYGIAQDKHDILYMGTTTLHTFDGDHWNQMKRPPLIERCYVDAMCSTTNGDIWLGTRGLGLYQFVPNDTIQRTDFNNWYHHRVEDGLASNTITGMLGLDNNHLLVATDNGICRFDGKNWTANIFPKQISTTASMGGSLKRSSDGSIWINKANREWYKLPYPASLSDNGAYENFWSVRLRPENQPPITEITLFEPKVSQPGNTIIEWRGKDVWEWTPEDKLEFSYRIDSDPWSPFTKETHKIFLSVPSGAHSFEIRARDMHFNIDPTPARVEFSVIPPLWRQPFLQFVVAATLAMVVFLLMRLVKAHEKHIKLQDRMEAEKIHLMDMMKLRFVTNISHEFRTPLTLILGILEQLGTSLKINQNQLNILNRNARRILRMLNQLLDLRKLESGKLTIEPSYGDIILFIHEIFESFTSMANRRQINYQFQTNRKSAQTWFDPDKLDKIVFNLLSNSFKFTPLGGCIEIHVKYKRNHNSTLPNGRNTGPPSVEICVKDTGKGIDEKQLPHIFESFYQEPGDDNHLYQGSGLGLALTKELIDLHHGTIQVTSVKNKGSQFIVELPVGQALIAEKDITHGCQARTTLQSVHSASDVDMLELNKSAATTDISVNDNGYNGDCPIILVVDDDPDIRTFIHDILQSHYHVIEANDGPIGLTKAFAEIPDLIICDVIMPEMDGNEFCHQIKHDERTSHVPIIMLSARSSEEYILKGLNNGADDYITKPFNAKILLTRVDNLIESRKQIQQRFKTEIWLEPRDIAISSYDEKFLQRVLDIVDAHIAEPDFNVDSLSKHIYLSRSQLFRKIKELTDQTPTEFIRIMRLKRAAQLLQKSHMNVSQIIYEVGFTDFAYFRKMFKKQFGTSPSIYALQHSRRINQPSDRY